VVSGRQGDPIDSGAADSPGTSWPADALEVGRVLDAWGVKGWIKVQPFSKEADALLSARIWFLRPPEQALSPVAARPAGPAYPPTLSISQARLHGDFVVALPRNMAERSAAEALRGARVFIARSNFPKAAEDEYYWVDLIGLEVRNREGVSLGRVSGLLDTGPHSVLQVQGDTGGAEPNERLIPFVAAYVDNVDLGAR